MGAPFVYRRYPIAKTVTGSALPRIFAISFSATGVPGDCAAYVAKLRKKR
jgi:hypothetical protein